ncbi:hypothetical protein V490_03227, partial [Pseudogymnoascus sp. VKM F-3557]
MRSISAALAVLAYASPALSQTAITVNTASQMQQMDGFGVSQAFKRAAEFQAMASGPRKQGLDYLFSTTTGAGLTIIRNRIGSGGAGDSILPTSPGSPSGTPNYQFDNNDEGQVWFSQQAMTYGVSTIYADAWSAPGFMKTNGNENGGGYLCGSSGHSCSSGDWRQAYANMLVQYVKYYAGVGVPITHLGFLNEPDYTPTYSGMLSDGNNAASFIPTLSAAVKAAGLSVKLTCCDAMGWESQKGMTSQLVAQGMEQYLSVITSHAYTSDPNSAMSTSLKKWQTEACDLNSAWSATWYSNGGPAEGLTWATKIHNGVVNAGLSAYLYWEGVEVNQFQASSYLVASNGQTVTPSGRLWAFAMWSRFVRPGDYRVATTGSVSSVAIAAFKNTDGKVAVIFTNTGGSAQSVKISVSGLSVTSATAYLTDNSHSVAETASTLSGGALTVSVPAHAMISVVLSGGGGEETTPPANTNVPSSTAVTPPVTTSQPPATGTVAQWGQCGGQGWTGGTGGGGLLMEADEAPPGLVACTWQSGLLEIQSYGMAHKFKSKDRTSRKVTPPSASYMSNDQFANYLAELRDNRIARPGGARPPPTNSRMSLDQSSFKPYSPAAAASSPAVDAPGRAESVISHRRARSSLSTTSRTGRALVQPPAPSNPPLSANVVVPSATYMVRGQRWMEREEMTSLRDALEDMDTNDELEAEIKLHAAAQQEASDLVWRHQHPQPTPEPDAPYRYRDHMRKNSYQHARAQSVGPYTGPDAVPVLGFPTRSVSGGSNFSSTQRDRVSSGSSNGSDAHPAQRPGQRV